jgi:hypothetical protein
MSAEQLLISDNVQWLHLAAFSWGGYLPSDHRTGFSTSQNLENLIFGTSETNSLMTRYVSQFYERNFRLLTLP